MTVHISGLDDPVYTTPTSAGQPPTTLATRSTPFLPGEPEPGSRPVGATTEDATNRAKLVGPAENTSGGIFDDPGSALYHDLLSARIKNLMEPFPQFGGGGGGGGVPAIDLAKYAGMLGRVSAQGVATPTLTNAPTIQIDPTFTSQLVGIVNKLKDGQAITPEEQQAISGLTAEYQRLRQPSVVPGEADQTTLLRQELSRLSSTPQVAGETDQLAAIRSEIARLGGSAVLPGEADQLAMIKAAIARLQGGSAVLPSESAYANLLTSEQGRLLRPISISPGEQAGQALALRLIGRATAPATALPEETEQADRLRSAIGVLSAGGTPEEKTYAGLASKIRDQLLAPLSETQEGALRVQATDRLEVERQNRKTQALDELGQRGITPTSGLARYTLDQIDRQFDSLRSQQLNDVVTREIENLRSRQTQALGIAQNVGEAAAGRSREAVSLGDLIRQIGEARAAREERAQQLGLQASTTTSAEARALRGEEEARRAAAVGYGGEQARLAETQFGREQTASERALSLADLIRQIGGQQYAREETRAGQAISYGDLVRQIGGQQYARGETRAGQAISYGDLIRQIGEAGYGRGEARAATATNLLNMLASLGITRQERGTRDLSTIAGILEGLRGAEQQRATQQAGLESTTGLEGFRGGLQAALANAGNALQASLGNANLGLEGARFLSGLEFANRAGAGGGGGGGGVSPLQQYELEQRRQDQALALAHEQGQEPMQRLGFVLNILKSLTPDTGDIFNMGTMPTRLAASQPQRPSALPGLVNILGKLVPNLFPSGSTPGGGGSSSPDQSTTNG